MGGINDPTRNLSSSEVLQYFEQPPEWFPMVARNLARAEIKPYAHLFAGQKRITLFDCGANRGCWTRGAIETFPDSIVSAHVFEPSLKNYNFMTDLRHGLLWTQEQYMTIRVNQVAVGDAPGELELYADWDGSWLGSLVKRPDIEVVQSETVPVVTIDDYAAEHGIHAIDILKLDVEGWELHALKGAKRLLDAGAVKLILFEFSSINVFTRTFFHDFWELLTPLGFEFFFLNHAEMLEPITKYEGRWEQFAGTVIYIARHKSLPGELPLPVPEPVQAEPVQVQAPAEIVEPAPVAKVNDRAWWKALRLRTRTA